MVTPAAPREAVAHLYEVHGVSQRRACTVIGVDRASIRYRRRRPDDGAVRSRLRELAVERRRVGWRRLAIDDAADQVRAVGEDGTLRHVIEAACKLDRRVGVSVYPAGTVNLVAMEYAYPKSAPAFARRLLTGAEGRAACRERQWASSPGLRQHWPGQPCGRGGLACVEAVAGPLCLCLRLPAPARALARATLILHHDGQQTRSPGRPSVLPAEN